MNAPPQPTPEPDADRGVTTRRSLPAEASQPAGWLPFFAIWLTAAALSSTAATLVRADLAVTLIVAAAALATWLWLRSLERDRTRAMELIAAEIDEIGGRSLHRITGPSRRGPVHPPLERRVSPGDAPEVEPVHDLNWLAARLDERGRYVERELDWFIRARASLRAIIDGVDTPVFATDERGIIRLCNRAGDRMFRRRAGRLAGLELEELFTQSSLLDLHARAQDGVAGREQVRVAVEGRPLSFEVSAVPVRLDISHLPAPTAQRAGVVLTLRDVTELAQAMQLKTDFVANASHELRTPMASIRAAVETMRGPAADDPAMRDRVVRMIESGIVRLEEMVADLLDLSHVEAAEQAPRVELVELADLVETFRSIFAPACQARGLTLTFDLEDGLERVTTDPRLLQLILRNLIDNATKFAFEQTDVRVDVRRDTGSTNGSTGVVFRVIDQGEGIPIKHQQRVFERFYQVDASRTRKGVRRGTGLGLAIVKHAVRQLGGRVDIDSIWQKGTTITVRLPECADEGSARNGATPRDPARPSADGA